jgi:CheY-like chemotaxis protein
MGLTGSFRGLSITEMLQLIRMAKKTGALCITLPEGDEQTLYFRKGQIIGVESGHESLGPILLEQEAITEEDLNEAIEKQKKTPDEPLEQILLDMGRLSQETVMQGLGTLAERTVGLLIQERGGQVSFEERAQPELKVEISLDLQSVLMAASVRADHARYHGDADGKHVYARSETGIQAFTSRQMELWLEDWKVFLAIDGKRTAEEIAAKARMDTPTTLGCIEMLRERGYIELTEWDDTRKTVLIVDDSLTIQKMVEMALEDENLRLIKVTNGAAAERAFEEERFDLVLLDVMLPDTNGYRLCQQLRGKGGRFAELPIVMLTARDAPQDENLGKHAGATAYMTKPFRPDELRERLRSLLGPNA